jgi:ubiquinone/menaquinone biosynthesis C-methylase UbiE
MANTTRLTSEDFSNFYKDENNTLPSGLKPDLVQHLLQQRLSKDWLDVKQRVINVLDFERFDDANEIKILDIGCGLGIDLWMMADEAMRLGKTVSIIGLDQNSTLIDESRKLYESRKCQLSSSNVSIDIVHGDILQLTFNDETFDIVRSDITLQHVDLEKAMIEVKRVLKTNGRLVALESGAGDMYSSDEVIINMYDTVLPRYRHGGTAIRLQFMLPTMNFRLEKSMPIANLQTGEQLALADRNWSKLKATGELLVTKGIITVEQSDDFQKRYINACQTNQILSAGIIFIIDAVKCQ